MDMYSYVDNESSSNSLLTSLVTLSVVVIF
jgi:hypothetical protein